MTTMDASPSSNGHGSDAWCAPWAHFSIDRRSPRYCRVTFGPPPTNTIAATPVAELAELVGLIEEDSDLNVVAFGSKDPDFYLAGYDVGHDPAWHDLLVRLARAPVVSIACIRGRVRGPSREFVLACDLRLASSEEVERIASRLVRFDHLAVARAKSYVVCAS